MKTRIISRKIFAPTVVFAAVLGFWAPPAEANTIALDFTFNQVADTGGNTTFGWAFTLTEQVTLTDLGVWDGNNGDPFTQDGGDGDGLIASHLVTIWTSGGAFVTSATVPSGTNGILDSGFRFISVAPLPLAAGDYVIGGLYRSDHDFVATNARGITTAAQLVYSGSRSGFGNAFPPDDGVGLPNGYFGPNFRFTTATNGVPDSGSTMFLMTCGIAALIALRWKLEANQ